MLANLPPAKLTTARKVVSRESFQFPDWDQQNDICLEVKQLSPSREAEQREGKAFLLLYFTVIWLLSLLLSPKR